MKEISKDKLIVICSAIVLCIACICGTIIVTYDMSNQAAREKQNLDTLTAREKQKLDIEARREREVILLEKEQKRPLKMWEKDTRGKSD